MEGQERHYEAWMIEGTEEILLYIIGCHWLSTRRPQDATCTCFQQNKTEMQNKDENVYRGAGLLLASSFSWHLLLVRHFNTQQKGASCCHQKQSNATGYVAKLWTEENLSQTSYPPNGILMGRSMFTNVFSCLQTMSIMNSYHLHNKHPFSQPLLQAGIVQPSILWL